MKKQFQFYLIDHKLSDTLIPEFPKRSHWLDGDSGARTTKSGKVKNKGPIRGETKVFRLWQGFIWEIC